jgi:hypothetical protein
MKKTKSYEINVCDFCDGNVTSYSKCIGCHRDICTNCVICYERYGFYCKECDKNLIDDPLHKAWVEMAAFDKRRTTILKFIHEEGKLIEEKICEAEKMYPSESND